MPHLKRCWSLLEDILCGLITSFLKQFTTVPKGEIQQTTSVDWMEISRFCIQFYFSVMKYVSAGLINYKSVFILVIVCCWTDQRPSPEVLMPWCFKTMRLRQNGWHFADNISKFIFLHETYYILNIISMKFVSKSPLNNNWVLVEITAWYWTNNKPWSEPMMSWTNDTYLHQHSLNELNV